MIAPVASVVSKKEDTTPESAESIVKPPTPSEKLKLIGVTKVAERLAGRADGRMIDPEMAQSGGHESPRKLVNGVPVNVYTTGLASAERLPKSRNTVSMSKEIIGTLPVTLTIAHI